MAGRILVIRGGAIGDFILTLPAIGLIRRGFPDCHLEILGYRHIAALADQRFYADATRSIDYAPMAGFFNPKAELAEDLKEYFSSFQQIISYLFDPDHFFQRNLKKCGVKNIILGNPKLEDHSHAAIQLARPLERLALFLDEPSAVIYPSAVDHELAASIFPNHSKNRFIALHPGSGSSLKNWPIEAWLQLMAFLRKDHPEYPLLIIGGEADEERLRTLRSRTNDPQIHWLPPQPLPVLSALLSNCRLFIGHDSGISHLAGASGTASVLLFGPTNPEVWAPRNPQVKVIVSPTRKLQDLPVSVVAKAVRSKLESFT